MRSQPRVQRTQLPRPPPPARPPPIEPRSGGAGAPGGHHCPRSKRTERLLAKPVKLIAIDATLAAAPADLATQTEPARKHYILGEVLGALAYCGEQRLARY